MQLVATLAAALMFVIPASSSSEVRQEERRLLDPKSVPAEGKTALDFVPHGWRLESEAEGDLNGDGRADSALRLVEDLPVEREGVPTERFRALVILFRKGDGALARAAVATKLLYCSTCGGMLGDPEGESIAVEIKGGVLNISQLSGARTAIERTQRFRFDPRTSRFVLIGEDVETYDRAVGDGTLVSTNYLTGLRVTETRKVAREGREPRRVSTRRTRIKASRRFIEDVDYEL